MADPIKNRINEEVKAALKQRDKVKATTLRMILAAIKQKEVDERISLNDQQILQILDKMLKQRREALQQYKEAGRDDLANKESEEIKTIQTFMPQPLSDNEIENIIQQAIAETNAASMQDMGKVMAIIKPQVQGRADMAQVSQIIKGMLS